MTFGLMARAAQDRGGAAGFPWLRVCPARAAQLGEVAEALSDLVAALEAEPMAQKALSARIMEG